MRQGSIRDSANLDLGWTAALIIYSVSFIICSHANYE